MKVKKTNGKMKKTESSLPKSSSTQILSLDEEDWTNDDFEDEDWGELDL